MFSVPIIKVAGKRSSVKDKCGTENSLVPFSRIVNMDIFWSMKNKMKYDSETTT